MMRRPNFELLLKSLQVVRVDVGNSPVIKVRIRPVQKLISLARYRFRSFCRVRRRWPNKQVDKVFAPFVNQRRDRPVIQIIQAAANQRKSLAGKIDNRRSKIELGVQPGFYRVLVGGSDIGEMVCHKRARMTGDELCREKLITARPLQSGHQIESDDRGENDRSRESQPIPRYRGRNGPSLSCWKQRWKISYNISHRLFGNLLSQRGLNSLTQFRRRLVIGSSVANRADERAMRFVGLIAVATLPQVFFDFLV